MKGVSAIIATILILLITISLAGTAYLFASGFILGKTSKTISLMGSKNNMIILSNDGKKTIEEDEIRVIVNGKDAEILNPQRIEPNGSANLVFVPPMEGSVDVNVIGPSNNLKYTINLKGYVDNDGDGANEIELNGKLVEVSIEAQTPLYYYDGHPSHYLWWPFRVDNEIWYVDATTGLQEERVIDSNKNGITNYNLTRCVNDGQFTGCTPETIGNRGRCRDGIVKRYSELEGSGWKTYYDDDLDDCDSGNPRLIYTKESWDVSGGTQSRIQLEDQSMSGYGKYRLCARYVSDSGLYSKPKCFEFIADWIDMDWVSGNGGIKSYGSTITWSANNMRTRYTGQPVVSNYLEKRCRIHPWNWFHNPTSESQPTITLRRHSTWDNRWAYLGIFFGIANGISGQHQGDVTINLPSGCYLRDSDGSDNYAWYHHECGWYHQVNGPSATAYCCSDIGEWRSTDLGNCDEFSVQNQRTITISNKFSGTGDNYDDIRIYIECPNGEASVFGNNAQQYTVSVSGVTNFWVNDMDYSTEMSFTEAFPDSQYGANIDTTSGQMSCDNLDLNICGRAYVYGELFNAYDIYGNIYTNPNYVCVNGGPCTHATC